MMLSYLSNLAKYQMDLSGSSSFQCEEVAAQTEYFNTARLALLPDNKQGNEGYGFQQTQQQQ